MPVLNTTSLAGPFFPNGSTTAFAFPFHAAAPGDVSVFDGNGSAVSPGLYVVTLNAGDGGTVTFSTAPTAAAFPELWIALVPSFAQTADFTNSGPSYDPRQLTRALDAIASRIIALKGETARSIKAPFDETMSELPAAGARAGRFLAFDPDGDPVAASGTGADGALRTDLAASSGAGLIGSVTGATVAQLLAGFSTRTAIKSLTPVVGARVRLVEPGRGGTFICRSGIPNRADPLEVRYLISATAGFYWEREWTGGPALAEWGGGAIDRGDIDSGFAMQAVIDLFGKLTFPKGVYYGTPGLDGSGAVIEGEGPLVSGYICSNATAHLLSNRGIGGAPGVTPQFVLGGEFRGFGLSRGVVPAQTASVAADRLQGHGLSFDMTSNPIVEDVYTYNNLVEVYLARTLSPKLFNLRGLRLVGFDSPADRWYGFWAFGDPAGMPSDWVGGPSGNPSALFEHGKFSCPPHANGIGYYLQSNLQDLWLKGKQEVAGAGIQFLIDPEGRLCSDAYIDDAVADGYLTHGMVVRNMAVGNSFEVRSLWLAPRSGATGAGLDVNGGHGLTVQSVTGNFLFAPTQRGVSIANSTGVDIRGKINNSEQPAYTVSMLESRVEIFGNCNANGSAAGSVITSIGGGRNTLIAGSRVSGTKQFITGVALDSSAAGNTIDVTRVSAASLTGARVNIAGAAITTQGNVSGHVVINPGAGAML